MIGQAQHFQRLLSLGQLGPTQQLAQKEGVHIIKVFRNAPQQASHIEPRLTRVSVGGSNRPVGASLVVLVGSSSSYDTAYALNPATLRYQD